MENTSLTIVGLKRELLEAIVRRRAPDLLDTLLHLDAGTITQTAREELRLAVGEELMAKGLNRDDEPNSYGRRLEDLIDDLGRAPTVDR